MNNSEAIYQALKPETNDKRCGSCHGLIKGLFRDHSFESCIATITRQRDELKYALQQARGLLIDRGIRNDAIDKALYEVA